MIFVFLSLAYITHSSLISTMETETIASRNVVDLLLQEKFNSSICHLDEKKREEGPPEGFVYGWDC
jgi:prenylcysteine oxidase/farnesylcysteine lyase